jgi:hypothetical protein
MYDLISFSDGDGFAHIPQTSAGLVRGRILRFDSGDYYCSGEAFYDVDLVVTGARAFWARWHAGRIIEVQEGAPYPDRSALGYLDKAQWEAGLDKKEPAIQPQLPPALDDEIPF